MLGEKTSIDLFTEFVSFCIGHVGYVLILQRTLSSKFCLTLTSHVRIIYEKKKQKQKQKNKKKKANFPENLIYWENKTYKNPFNSCFVVKFPA